MTQPQKEKIEDYIRTVQEQKFAEYPVGTIIIDEDEREKIGAYIQTLYIPVEDIRARTNLSFFKMCQDDHFSVLSVSEEPSQFFIHVITELADTGVVDTRFPAEHDPIHFNTTSLKKRGMVFLLNEEQFKESQLARLGVSACRIIK